MQSGTSAARRALTKLARHELLRGESLIEKIPGAWHRRALKQKASSRRGGEGGREGEVDRPAKIEEVER